MFSSLNRISFFSSLTLLMLLACPSCGTKNRVPDERLRDDPVCGRCGAELASTAEEMAAQAQALEQLVAFFRVAQDSYHATASSQLRAA